MQRLQNARTLQLMTWASVPRAPPARTQRPRRRRSWIRVRGRPHRTCQAAVRASLRRPGLQPPLRLRAWTGSNSWVLERLRCGARGWHRTTMAPRLRLARRSNKGASPNRSATRGGSSSDARITPTATRMKITAFGALASINRSRRDLDSAGANRCKFISAGAGPIPGDDASALLLGFDFMVRLWLFSAVPCSCRRHSTSTRQALPPLPSRSTCARRTAKRAGDNSRSIDE